MLKYDRDRLLASKIEARPNSIKLGFAQKLIVRTDVGQGMQNRERGGATGSALNAINKQNDVHGR